MDGQLKAGTSLVSENSNKYTVISQIGAGSQGEVYEVDMNGGRYALKWYYQHSATQTQRDILDDLISKGAPDSTFLWPQEIVFIKGVSFGYIMPLRPKRYKSVVDLMKRRAEPSFYMLCRAAYNLINGYRKLHTMGYSYRDISFGNLFFDPDTGDALICDNDNVSANDRDDSCIYGTPRFMAPEIVIGKAKPSRNTDLYSLAVLLFYMLMLGHPLDGKLEANIKCMDTPAMNKLYGENPVFVYDPADKSNRPVKGYHDNVIIYWNLYPQIIRDLLTKSFTDGLTHPNKRVTENQWLDAFANLMTGITICPKCGAESFFDEHKVASSASHSCWSCNKPFQPPASIVIGKNRVLLDKNAKLYSHSIYADYDMNTVVGEVVQNPFDPSILGVMNMSADNWTYINADAQQKPIAVGKSGTITKGAKINFGKCVGEFKQ